MSFSSRNTSRNSLLVYFSAISRDTPFVFISILIAASRLTLKDFLVFIAFQCFQMQHNTVYCQRVPLRYSVYRTVLDIHQYCVRISPGRQFLCLSYLSFSPPAAGCRHASGLRSVYSRPNGFIRGRGDRAAVCCCRSLRYAEPS